MNVITLVHGRSNHLANLIQGLERSSLIPDGLWIVHMNEIPGERTSRLFPINCRRVNNAAGLPLAKARNSVVAIDPAADWVFLDVDCIPTQDLLAHYFDGLRERPDALHMGQVRYLPEDANRPGWNETMLYGEAAVHPLAQFRGGPGAALPHHLFWSLNFACRADLFARIGGFDEGYRGYGGEDTDFAFRARQHDVTVVDNSAMAFHQYHPTYDPPLNHFADIVANARRFYSRWGVWPMEGWLGAFRDHGLLRWTDEHIEIIRAPSAHEVAQALNTERPGF